MNVCHKYSMIYQNLVNRISCNNAEYKQAEEGYDIKDGAKHGPLFLNKIHSR